MRGESGGGGGLGRGRVGRPCHLQACSEFQVFLLCSDWRPHFLSQPEHTQTYSPHTQTYPLWRGLSLGEHSYLFGFRIN